MSAQFGRGLGRGGGLHGARQTRNVVRSPLEAPTVFWWMDRESIKRSEGPCQRVPFRGIPVGFKVFLLVLPGIERKTSMDADGKVRVLSQARRRKECEARRSGSTVL